MYTLNMALGGNTKKYMTSVQYLIAKLTKNTRTPLEKNNMCWGAGYQ